MDTNLPREQGFEMTSHYSLASMPSLALAAVPLSLNNARPATVQQHSHTGS
jgi:hypothetical protein